MKLNKTKCSKWQKWFLRNIPLLFLIGVIITSISVGSLICSLCIDANATSNPVENNINTTLEPIPSSNVPVTNQNLKVDEESIEKVFYYNVPLSHELQDYIRNLCIEYDVPMDLVMAVIEVESSFRSGVVSKTNDYGLMQINKINHEWLSETLEVTDFLDPYENVLCGIYILSDYIGEGEDIVKGLMCYNCGKTGAKRLWDKGIYSTTYTDKIMTAYENYKKEAATVR